LKKNVIFVGGSGLIGKSLINDIRISSDFNCLNFDLRNSTEKSSLFFRTDASKMVNLNTAIQRAHKKHGLIYAVVNCAYPKALQKIDLPNINSDKFSREISNHLGLYLNVIQCFAKYFDKKKTSKIINFSSIYGSFMPRFEIYKNTSISTMPLQYLIIKSSINKLMEYSAKFFLKKNIKINNISPGGVQSSMEDKFFTRNYGKFTSNNKLLNCTDLNGLVNFLLSSHSDKITGQNIIIDDGFTL
jgi:NAD(P)-dependent dehydrogenase (short-subunit alcohol dehydrogenase family)